MEKSTKEKLGWKAVTKLAKFESGAEIPYDKLDDLFNHRIKTLPHLVELVEVEGNIALKTGINAIFSLITHGPTNVDLFSAANAEIGAGESSTPANRDQTGLLGSRATFKGMDMGFPMAGANEEVIFQSTFNEDEAGTVENPMDWNEWTVRNGTGEKGGVCLNRRVQYLGTKAGGKWVLQVALQMV